MKENHIYKTFEQLDNNELKEVNGGDWTIPNPITSIYNVSKDFGYEVGKLIKKVFR